MAHNHESGIASQRIAWAYRMVLAMLCYDAGAFHLTRKEIPDCVECWRDIAIELVMTATHRCADDPDAIRRFEECIGRCLDHGAA